jgi:hypothetical protein
MRHLTLVTQANSTTARRRRNWLVVYGILSCNQHKEAVVKSTMANLEVSFFVFRFFRNQQNIDCKNSLSWKSLMILVRANRPYSGEEALEDLKVRSSACLRWASKTTIITENRCIAVICTFSHKPLWLNHENLQLYKSPRGTLCCKSPVS